MNRRGLLGPVAVRPDLMGQGKGKGVLLGALHELRRRGAERISVVWIGPVVPYAAVGGRVGEVYFVYRKELRVNLLPVPRTLELSAELVANRPPTTRLDPLAARPGLHAAHRGGLRSSWWEPTRPGCSTARPR